MKITNTIYLAATLLFASNAIAAAPATQENNLVNRRIQLLESALQPTNADTLVKMYAEAVLKRNGAVQYMLFCPELQKKHLAEFQEMNWVTGVSSPLVMSYEINNKGGQKYVVNFTMGMQGKKSGLMVDALGVHEEGFDQKDSRYCISAYSSRLEADSLKVQTI